MTRRLLSVCVTALVALAGCGSTTTRNITTTVIAPAADAPATRAVPATSGFGAVYAREGSGVVTVIAVVGRGASLGSGFVVSGKGEIATNAHVVTSGEGASIKRASRVYVRFADGNQVSAKIVGVDPFSDVALIKVDAGGLTLRPLPLGSTRAVKVGAPVAAIGSPFGEEQSLSVGVVSATQRSIDSLTGFATTGAIQTDAAINHGNSGGPLLAADGRVLGINSQIRSDTGEGSGVGFAIPIDVVERSLHQLRVSGRARYGYLGLSTGALYPQLAMHFGLNAHSGDWVQGVVKGGPADKAGVRAAGPTASFQEQSWHIGGDVIVAVDSHKVADDNDLSQALLSHVPGDKVRLHLLRDNKPLGVTVTLGERPLNEPSHG